LTVELIKAIKEAEAKAESIIREAQLEARQAQKGAESKANLIMQEAIAAADQKAKELIKNAEDDARAEAKPLVAERQKEIIHMQKAASGRMAEVIAVLTDKVVKIDADN